MRRRHFGALMGPSTILYTRLVKNLSIYDFPQCDHLKIIWLKIVFLRNFKNFLNMYLKFDPELWVVMAQEALEFWKYEPWQSV